MNLIDRAVERARLSRFGLYSARARKVPSSLVERFHEERDALALWRSGLRNRYRGRRCFIIGNGPSLTQTDLTLLKNEITFGANRLYMLFDDIGFATTFYLVTDPNIVTHYHEDIDRVRSRKFLRPYHRRFFPLSKDALYIRDQAIAAPCFAFQPARGLWTAGTVTYVALQLAHFMGFDTAILVGVDHSYKQGTSYRAGVVPHGERLVLTAQGNEGNHFSPDYYQPGVPWVVPNPEHTELAYRMAKFAFERDGRQVLDATIGGRLQVFPKVAYRTMFAA